MAAGVRNRIILEQVEFSHSTIYKNPGFREIAKTGIFVTE
jgi:hypothetical protein